MADYKAPIKATLVAATLFVYFQYIDLRRKCVRIRVLLAAILFVSFRYVAAFSLVQSLALWAVALVVCWTVEELLSRPPQFAPFRLRMIPNWQALLLDFGPAECKEQYRPPTLDFQVQKMLWESVRNRVEARGAGLMGEFHLVRDGIVMTFLKPGVVYWDAFQSFSRRTHLEWPTETKETETGFEAVYVRSSIFRSCSGAEEWFPMEIGLIGTVKWWESVLAANKELAETCPAIAEASMNDILSRARQGGGAAAIDSAVSLAGSLAGGSRVRFPHVEIKDGISGTARVPLAIIPSEQFLEYWIGGGELLKWEARAKYGWEEVTATCIKHKYFTVEHDLI